MSILKIIIFYSIYHLIMTIFIVYAYFVLKKYYRHIKYKEKETGKEIDIQDKFAPLVPKDNITFFIVIPPIFYFSLILKKALAKSVKPLYQKYIFLQLS